MKLQIRNEELRLRVDEAELAALTAGEELRLAPRLGGRPLLELSLRLAERLDFDAARWSFALPRAEVLAYAGTLPRRDALAYMLGDGTLQLKFEVDVRDSVQVRGARRGR